MNTQTHFKLETKRLLLQEFSKDDAKGFFELNNDIDTLKYTGDTSFQSIEAAEIFIKECKHYTDYGFGRWSIRIKSNNEFIGFCGLKYSPLKQEIDIGFRIMKKYWKQGYATEAAKKMFSVCF
ncbi:GNAT family N-acetyltransferase [Flammeovirga kamogawensis]|uniref:GNAT family N-acetyltransferase n=1 Tax=Flammeovirga kamogawensis TaxID=373891 RepID=A0ABX8GTJ5_9BACT|nr:GNAT family N-acetyltransferase [Flammeovirga kamogawensis]MBB6460123.1 RimJ/RimL family protein N-acetyltransferase [Flammeovirga kamogawensis]QWG06836.1 GNAT family N-acetyltransferase [Flammeovirga kamogawensis]TRX68660.1 GNAT family N-acetyltransferase [Flammeovirga kamogawensis]